MGRSGRGLRARGTAVAVVVAVMSMVALPPGVVRAADVGYRDFSYAAAGVSAPTGQKPQSKLWVAEGSWWGALYSIAASGYTVQKLDWSTQQWEDTGVVVEPRHSSYLDVLFDGTHLYVAGAGTSLDAVDSLQIRRLSYQSASATWSVDPGFPVTIASGGMEAAVIDKDSTGAVWATWTRGNAVYVSHTTIDDRTWTTPFVIPAAGSTTLSSDDISAVVAFDGKVGVMWSNQNDGAMYFAIHVDGDPDGSWSQNPAIQGPEYADDHMNLKSLQADTEGRVYAVTKTSLNAEAAPLILVSVLSRQGSWSRATFGTVADNHTRPILLIDQQNKQLYVFAASPCCSGGTIYVKQSPLDHLSFETGLGAPFIQSTLDSKINNPASTKQALDSSTGLVVIAGDDGTKRYLHNAITLGVDDQAPETTITSAPADGSTSIDAVFDFASSEVGSTFRCQLDGGGFEACTPPQSYPGIADGSHTFDVAATDAAGNTDPTPASWTWTVAPLPDGGTSVLNPTADTFVDQNVPTVNYGSTTTLESDAGSGVEKDALLKFDTTGVPGMVTAARLRIYVTNGTGNGPPVYPTATTWDESTVTWNTRPSTTGDGVADAGAIPLGAYYEYDVTPLVVAGTEVSLALLPQSTDAVKFNSRETSSPPELVVDWVGGSGGGGDTTPPETTIDSGPSGVVGTGDAQFTFSASEAGATFECRLDSGDWAGCTSPAAFSGLAEGAHTFDVRGTDVAGNTDLTPASRSWSIDLTPPAVGTLSPAADAMDVPVNTPVKAQLSEAIDVATVTTSTFTLAPDGGSPVPAAVSYQDTTRTVLLTSVSPLNPSTTYAATIDGMRDLAGNPVTPTTWSFTTAAPPAGASLVAVADAYVDERKATRNYGTASSLTSDYASNASKRILVKFDVSGVPTALTSAKLRLWVTNGSTNGPELYAAGNGWTETGVTWSSMPATTGQVGDAAQVTAGAWYEYDVANSVTGDGTYTFLLSSRSTDATTVASRETATAPVLVLEWQP